jgi:hypothetical protein
MYSFIWDDKPDKVERFNFSGLLLGWHENDKLKVFLLFHNEVDRTSPGYRGKWSSFKLFQESKTSFQNLFF